MNRVSTVSNDFALAQRAAMEAGRLLREQRAAWNQVTSATQHDIKLQANCAVETVILKMHRRKDGDLQLTPV